MTSKAETRKAFENLTRVLGCLSCHCLTGHVRSEEHTSELQSRLHLVCRLLLEKKKVNITSNVTSRERSVIHPILHELTPLFTINLPTRDIPRKNVYSRVNSKATTQWRKTESANGVHLEGVASDNRSS